MLLLPFTIMTLDSFLQYCLAKPGVTEEYPFEGECAWLKVGGKMFALVNITEMKMGEDIVPPFHFANLKCDPERAIELRETYDEVRPGWHMSKKHWNTIYFNGSLKDSMIKELTDHAYDLVVDKLPKKIKDNLSNE